MPKIQADRRLIEAEPDVEGERVAAVIAAEYLDVRLRFARALLRIERGRTYALSACASIVQYAVRLGVPASEARALVDLGRALEAPLPTSAPPADGSPEGCGDGGARASVEERIRSGHLAVESAAVAGRLLAEPGLLRPGEDWLQKAEALRPSELRREVQARVEAVAQGTPALLPITVHVTERVRDEFHRARSLVSREAQLMLTEGQAFARIVRFYLDSEDELRDGRGDAGRSDAPRGSTAPARLGCRVRTRYVQASARRAVLGRSRDRCEVPGCPHDTFLEFAHIEAHARGGTTDSRNLLRLCHAHHTQFDAGVLVFIGWTDPGGDCRPEFRSPATTNPAAEARSDCGRSDSADEPGDAPGIHYENADSERPRIDDEARAGFSAWDGAEGDDRESEDDDPCPPRRSRRRGGWSGDRDRGAWFVSESTPPPWNDGRMNGSMPRRGDVDRRRPRGRAGRRRSAAGRAVATGGVCGVPP